MDALSELNQKQQEAVQAIKGPVLILAGPGSGKTRVITQRVAYLIKVVGINPRRILAVTFTNKAAKEMVERLEKLVPGSVKQLTVGTFHAICARILRIDGQAIGIAPEFVIYDGDDQMAVIKRCFAELNLDPKQHAPQSIASVISNSKSKMISAADFAKHSRSYFEEVVGRVYERYEKNLIESKALDFDDLLVKTVLLFRKNPEILARYQERYIHVMVDETDRREIPQHLCRGRPRPVDLFLAFRRPAEYSEFRARLSRCQSGLAGTELPVDEKHPGNRVQCHFGESETESQETLDGERPG